MNKTIPKRDVFWIPSIINRNQEWFISFYSQDDDEVIVNFNHEIAVRFLKKQFGKYACIQLILENPNKYLNGSPDVAMKLINSIYAMLKYESLKRFPKDSLEAYTEDLTNCQN